MKITVQRLFILCFCVVMLGSKVFAQGIGNHLTMSLSNCTQPSLNSLQFDLYVVSDGASTSDLRANSFQFGVNLDSTILQSGATLTPSYVPGSSDLIPPLNAISFPNSNFKGHVRISQSPLLSNPGNTMQIGHQYRYGTFVLTSSANFLNNGNPNFSLQASVAGGKTVCAGLVYVGTNASSTAISVSGTGNGQRVVSADCSLIINSVNEFNGGQDSEMHISAVNSILNVQLPPLKRNATLQIYDALGRAASEVINVPANTNSKQISTFGLRQGIYLLRMKEGEEIAVKRFIKE